MSRGNNTRGDVMKFMENFDPEQSNREKRKLVRKVATGGRRRANNLYDEKGLLVSNGKDVCDCLEDKCPGCHFPCPKCRSPKCGPECRVNRKWAYEYTQVEGTDEIITNKNR